MSATDTAISVTETIGSVASFGRKALPVAKLLARFGLGLIPGIGPIVNAVIDGIQTAQDLGILEKIETGAPIFARAIDQGRPIFEAIGKAGPQMLPALKQLFAVAVNADPNRPETDMTPDQVGDATALAFAGPVLMGRRWTREEEERWFQRSNTGGW